MRIKTEHLGAVTIALVSALLWGPLLMAPPFLAFRAGGLARDNITYDHEYQQIWGRAVSMGTVTDWLLVAISILQWRVYTRQAGILSEQARIANKQRKLMKGQLKVAETAANRLRKNRELRGG